MNLIGRFSNFIKLRVKKLVLFVEKRPLLSFFGSLIILLALIGASNFFFKPKIAPAPSPEAKKVQVYQIGEAPKLSFQGQVKKTGIVKIQSQVAGIISKINVKEGQSVSRGKNLFSISSSYTGGNPAAVSAQIANRQFQFNQDTYQTQKDMVSQQKEAASQTNENFNQLRDISNQSLQDTNSLLDLNSQILDTLNANLQTLKDTNTNNVNAAAILQTQTQIAQIQSGFNLLKSQQRSLQFQTNTDNPPQKLSDLQKEITLKQLDIQDKSLDMNKDLSKLQVQVANLSAAMFSPASPFTGVVERVFVKLGQSVTPGTNLAVVSGKDQNLSVVVLVPENVARKISKLENSTLSLKDKELDMLPTFVSTQATDGQLYSVIFQIPKENRDQLTDESFINVELPIVADAAAKSIFLPLDAVFQTQEESIVYLAKDGKAESQAVKLGNVQGGFVEVLEGLTDGDRVILNRNIIQGDKVEIEKSE